MPDDSLRHDGSRCINERARKRHNPLYPSVGGVLRSMTDGQLAMGIQTMFSLPDRRYKILNLGKSSPRSRAARTKTRFGISRVSHPPGLIWAPVPTFSSYVAAALRADSSGGSKIDRVQIIYFDSNFLERLLSYSEVVSSSTLSHASR